MQEGLGEEKQRQHQSAPRRNSSVSAEKCEGESHLKPFSQRVWPPADVEGEEEEEEPQQE